MELVEEPEGDLACAELGGGSQVPQLSCGGLVGVVVGAVPGRQCIQGTVLEAVGPLLSVVECLWWRPLSVAVVGTLGCVESLCASAGAEAAPGSRDFWLDHTCVAI